MNIKKLHAIGISLFFLMLDYRAFADNRFTENSSTTYKKVILTRSGPDADSAGLILIGGEKVSTCLSEGSPFQYAVSQLVSAKEQTSPKILKLFVERKETVAFTLPCDNPKEVVIDSLKLPIPAGIFYIHIFIPSGAKYGYQK